MTGKTEQKKIKQWIRQSQAGDHEAFAALIRHYENRVLSIAYRIVNNREEARDIAQNVFIRLYRFLPTYKNEKKFFTWLYQITVNASIDVLKKSRRYCELPRDFDKIQKTEIHSKDTHEKIMNLINHLSTPQKTAFLLREVEGFSCKEVAKIMDNPEGTVRSHLFYARKNLRTWIEKIYPEFLEG